MARKSAERTTKGKTLTDAQRVKLLEAENRRLRAMIKGASKQLRALVAGKGPGPLTKSPGKTAAYASLKGPRKLRVWGEGPVSPIARLLGGLATEGAPAPGARIPETVRRRLRVA